MLVGSCMQGWGEGVSAHGIVMDTPTLHTVGLSFSPLAAKLFVSGSVG